MFKFAHKRQVWWPVTIKAPKDDGSGACDEVKVEVLFELMTISETRAQESLGAEEQSAVLRGKVKGWRGIADTDGNPLDCTPENLVALLDVPYVERAFGIGLLQATVGAPAKN